MSSPIFATVAEARAACVGDKLATIYRRAGSVFVATAHGTGTFTAAEWDGLDAPHASVYETGRRLGRLLDFRARTPGA